MFKSALFFSSLLFGAGLCQRRTSTRTSTRPSPQPTVQSMWGQCGGREYTGPVACPTAAYCMNDGENEWYSQCIPIESEDPDNDDGPTIVTVTIGTIFSVSGPTPTVVTTFITVLAPEPTQPPPSVTTVTLIPDDPIWKRTAGSS